MNRPQTTQLSRKGALGGISVLTAAALMVSVAPSWADDPQVSQATQAAAVVEKATGTEDLADSAPVKGGATQAAVFTDDGRITVTAPSAATGQVTSTAPDGSVVSIGLPATSDVRGAEAGAGTVVYPNASKSTDLAVQPTTDGGVRALVTLKDRSASTTQRFTIDVPNGASLHEDGRGGYEITNESTDGVHTVIASVAAPWAKDANGKPVATRYTLDGDQLVQTIDVNDHTAFPVVADPKFTWGIVTGTAYFNRTETRRIAQNGAITAMAAWALPPGLNAYVSMHSAAITVTANKAYATKRCIKIKFAAGLFIPDQYSGGYCK
ncbi:hypothetical protein [Streptomyces sp. NPDC019539]|uniref:hypothetical protein n=1 Tax=Streptomyces sp. NPDC019539 TaxID=3365063 RepID=UPI0037BAB2BA